MLGSKSNYFHKNKAQLNNCAFDVISYLKLKGYSDKEIDIYLKAFNYFCDNPDQFDGATLVRDLCDLPGLDIDAMYHDYCYINYNVASSVSNKFRADKLFLKGIERKGKSQYAAYSRFAGLTLSGLGFIPFARLSRGKMTELQKLSFMLDYDILVKK